MEGGYSGSAFQPHGEKKVRKSYPGEGIGRANTRGHKERGRQGLVV